MLLYVTAVLTGIVIFVYWYITRTFNYWRDRNVVSPPSVPLFGNLKNSALRKEYIGHVLKGIYDQFPNEKVVGMYRMTRPTLLIRDLDIIKDVMIKNFDKFGDRGVDFSDVGLGNNLFHSNYDTWRPLRARFSPMFTSSKLKNMFPLLLESADSMYKYIEKDIQLLPEQNVSDLTKKFTFSTINACAFGIDIEMNNVKMKDFEKFDKMFLIPSYAHEVDMVFPGILKKLGASIVSAQAHAFFSDLVKKVIDQRNGEPTTRKDFIDLLLEIRKEKVIRGGKNADNMLELEITDNIIVAQAFIFYLGGFETSSTTTGYLLYELSQNTHVQVKLIAEIDEYLEKSGDEIKYDDLMNMPYLTMVFDETLRKYPIVEPIQRRALDDYKIPGMDLVVKKGQMVYLSALGVHYDSKYYPNPEIFDPERFSPENSKDRHSCAYFPFGVGPRNCIGMRFGKLQSRLFVVKLLSKFRIEPSENTPSKLSYNPNYIVLKAAHGIRLNIVPRDK